MRRLCLTMGLLLLPLGIFLIAGPGDALHHELHRHHVLIFAPCCCVLDAGHTACSWTDHFGHPWQAHRRIVLAGWCAVVAALLLMLPPGAFRTGMKPHTGRRGFPVAAGDRPPTS